jgi:hypothetical protein
MKRLLVLLMLLAIPGIAQARTWTVTPTDSLTDALNGASPGDIVLLGNGTYSLHLHPTNSGTSGSRITYVGNLSSPGSVKFPSIDLRGKSHVTVKGVSTDTVGGQAAYVYMDSTSANTLAEYDSLVSCNLLGPLRMLGTDYSHVSDVHISGAGTFSMTHGHGNSVRGLHMNTAYTSSVVAFNLTTSDSNAFSADTITSSHTIAGSVGTEIRSATRNTFTDNVWSFTNAIPTAGTTNLVSFLMRNASQSNTFLRDSFVVNVTADEAKTGSIELSQYSLAIIEQKYNTWNDCHFRTQGQIAISNGSTGYNFTGCVFYTIPPLALTYASSNRPSDSLTFRHNTVISLGSLAALFAPASGLPNSTIRSNLFYSEYSANVVNSQGNVTTLSSDSNAVFSHAYETDSSRAFRGPGGSDYSAPRAGVWLAAGRDSNSRWLDPGCLSQGSWANGGHVPQNSTCYDPAIWKDGYVGAGAGSSATDQNTLTVTYGSGVSSVTLNPDRLVFSDGESVEVWPSIVSGYSLGGWSITGAASVDTSTNSHAHITFASSDVTVAITATTNAIELHYFAGSNGRLAIGGTVSGDSTLGGTFVMSDTVLAVYYGETSPLVCAMPNNTYQFTGWVGRIAGNRTRQDVATDTLHVTANFYGDYSNRTWAVTDNASMATANSSAQAGDLVTIAAGTYTTGIHPAQNGSNVLGMITYVGSLSDPGSRNVASVILTDHEYISVKGIEITTTATYMLSGAHDSLSYCLISASYPQILGGSDNMMSNCTFNSNRFTVAATGAMKPGWDNVASGVVDYVTHVARDTIRNCVINLSPLNSTSNTSYFRSAAEFVIDSTHFNVTATTNREGGSLVRFYYCEGFKVTDSKWTYYNTSTNAIDQSGFFAVRDSTHNMAFVRDTFNLTSTGPTPLSFMPSDHGNIQVGADSVAGTADDPALLGHNSNSDNSYSYCVWKVIGPVRLNTGAIYYQDGASHQTFDHCTFVTNQDAMHFNGRVNDLNIDHCTFISGAPAARAVFDDGWTTLADGGTLQWTGSNSITNSIFATFSGTALREAMNLAYAFTNITSNNNLFYTRRGSGYSIGWSPGAAPAFPLLSAPGIGTEWHLLTGQDGLSIYGNPQFIDSTIATFNGRLRLTSPARGAGTGGSDIGAYSSAAGFPFVVLNDGHGEAVKSPNSASHVAGDVIQLTATAGYGYAFSSWTLSSGLPASSNNPYFHTMGNVADTVTANFFRITFPLSYSAGANGSISGDTTQAVLYGDYGSAVLAVPDPLYEFAVWSDSVSTAWRSDRALDTLSVSAIFRAQILKTLTYSANPSSFGTVTGDSMGQFYSVGDTVTLTATAASGKRFDRWTVNGVWYDENPLVLICSGDMTIVGEFAIAEYPVTYTALEGGTIDGEAMQMVTHGGSGTWVTAVPNHDWMFSYWTNSSPGTPTPPPILVDDWSEPSRIETNVIDTLSYEAVFVRSSLNCTTTYRSEANGHIYGDTLQVDICGHQLTPVMAVPDTGYVFWKWTISAGTLVSLIASRLDTPTLSQNYRAHFTVATFTLSYAASPGGRVTGTATQTVTYGASGTMVTAVPSPGFYFSKWSDGVTTLSRTDSNVRASLTVSAVFLSTSVPVITTPVRRSRTRISDCVVP